MKTEIRDPRKAECVSVLYSCLNDYETYILNEEYWPTEEMFVQAYSYARYILSHAITLVLESNLPPLVVLENLADRLDKWGCENPNTSFIFSSSYDAIEFAVQQLL